MMNESNSKVKVKATMCQGDWMIKCEGHRESFASGHGCEYIYLTIILVMHQS